MTLFVHTLECDNSCGAKIELTHHQRGHDDTMAVAELLGWKTVDRGKRREVDVYCGFCQARAKRIVEGQ